MIRLLLVVLGAVGYISGVAQVVPSGTLVIQDSLILQTTDDGSLYLTWRAGSETTLATILDATGFGSSEIHEINPILHFRGIEPYDLILIPFDLKMVSPSLSSTGYPLLYKVRQGETLFGIAKRTLQMPVDSLIHFNAMGDAGVRAGQILTIGKLKKLLPVSTPTAVEEITISSTEISNDLPFMSPAKKYTTQKGVAWWNKSKPDPNLFVLHRWAPINSVLEIHNPMFGRSVRAKVIGTIPPTYTEDIAIIVSQGVARSLGALDGRFYVEVTYEVR